jgi:hypothetical protein
MRRVGDRFDPAVSTGVVEKKEGEKGAKPEIRPRSPEHDPVSNPIDKMRPASISNEENRGGFRVRPACHKVRRLASSQRRGLGKDLMVDEREPMRLQKCTLRGAYRAVTVKAWRRGTFCLFAFFPSSALLRTLFR